MPHPAIEGHPPNLLFWEEGFVFFFFQNHDPERVSPRSGQDQGPALVPKHQMWVNKQRGTEQLELSHQTVPEPRVASAGDEMEQTEGGGG